VSTISISLLRTYLAGRETVGRVVELADGGEKEQQMRETPWKRSLVGVLFAIAGCSGKASQVQVEDVRAAMFPQPNSDVVVSNKKVRQQLAVCMKLEGFEFEQSTIGLKGDPELIVPEGTYGVSIKPRPTVPNKIPQGFGTPEYEKALKGSASNPEPTPDSCLGKALAMLKDGVQLDSKKAGKISKKYEAIYVNDERVRKITSGWAPCMKKSSFQFTEPGKIVEYLEDRLAVSSTEELVIELQKEERTIWATDQECQKPFASKLAKIRMEYELQAATDYLESD
jgi:hypothetical protein